LIANATLWGNASKLVALAVGVVISYTFMRFWTFASGSQDRPKKQENLHQSVIGSTTILESSVTEHAHHPVENEDSRAHQKLQARHPANKA